MSGRHIPIGTWLDALNIPQYVHLFHQYGGVEDLIYCTESDIRDVGIRNGGHRAKIVSSLRILREKYEKGHSTGSGFIQRSQSQNSYTTTPVPYPEGQHLIASPEKLNKDLERELAGDPTELRSNSWYHGSIPREHAESNVKDNGDFLVRDCISKPGDFVLTCRWKGTPLNFMINAIVGNCAPGHLPPLSFRFDEESFPSIQQLIQYYQNQAKPITVTSGAIIKNPVPRSMPLSYYDTKYGALINFVASAYQTPTQSPKASPFITPVHSPSDSPNMNRKGVVWTGSHPALNVANNLHRSTSRNESRGDSTPDQNSRSSSLDRCESLPVINLIPPGDNAPKEIAPPPPRAPVHQRSGSEPLLIPAPNSDANNNNDHHQNGDTATSNGGRGLSHKKGRSLSPFGHRNLLPASSDSDLTSPPPPKPSRVPSVKYKQKPMVVVRNKHLEDDDRDYSDYFQVREEPSWLKNEKANRNRPLPQAPISQLSPQSNLPPQTQPQRGRRAQRLNKDNNAGFYAPVTIPKSPGTPGSKESARVPPVFTGLVPIYRDENQPPPSPSYHLVARSRSFQGDQEEEDNDSYTKDYDNNFNNKGYSTLPTRSSKKKINRARKGSETRYGVIDKSNTDYDYPLDNSEKLLIHDFLPQNLRRIVPPNKTPLSAIRPDLFNSNLLPKGHKVLDQNVIFNAKAILLNKAPRAISLHLTKIDSSLTVAVDPKDLGMGVTSGLELMTLPQGSQLRKDLIERWESLRLFTMLTVLFSQNVTEIAKVLSMWIQACFELKMNAGNLFSFTAIMAGLTCPTIHRLKDSWLILRQNHTSSAYLFDTKLRPAFTTLKDGSSDLPLNNVSIPFILPVSLLLELEEGDISDLDSFWWEEGLDKVGVAIDVLLTHLDTARIIASQCSLYRMTGSALMSKLVQDPDLEVVLSPVFHVLLLWGDRGWAAPRNERVEKLNKIFSLLSNKHQVPGDDGTEV